MPLVLNTIYKFQLTIDGEPHRFFKLDDIKKKFGLNQYYLNKIKIGKIIKWNDKTVEFKKINEPVVKIYRI